MQWVVDHVLPAAYAVLPEELRTQQAARMILAIGAQSSRFKSRRLMSKSARRGYWLLEADHVGEVLRFTKGRGPLLAAGAALGYGLLMMEELEIRAALEHNDVLGAIVARCMLPPHLEALDSAGSAWMAYRSIWRPRGAAAELGAWEAHYAAAGAAVEGRYNSAVGCS